MLPVFSIAGSNTFLIEEPGAVAFLTFFSESNRKDYIPGSASLLVSKIGSGRVVVFADNPNFRGTWYGTHKLFLNAIFLGDNISVPTD